MRLRKIYAFLLSAVALVATACGSDDPDNPGTNPTPDPTPGPEAPVYASASTDLIYQANPRFYGNKDCLKALTADVARLKSMNINILWVMPPLELGVEKAIGSPYCIKDYKKIDPTLGTLEDWKTLVNTCHANGIKVLMDWVANHTSFDNTWTKDHPERYKKDANGNIAATPMWGDVAQLDYNQKSTREGMIDAMSYWITETKIDGYRCDHVEGVPHSFWQEDIEALTKLDAQVFMLAESNDVSYLTDGFYMIYDWNFPKNVITMLDGGNPSKLFDFVKDRNAQIPEGKALLRYAFNHDVASENNVATYFKNQDGTVLTYMLAAFTGETPMIYSSMDVEGLTGKLSFFSNAHRTLKFSDKLTKAYADINSAYIKSAVARGGDMKNYANSDAFILEFENGSAKCLVVANARNEHKTIKMPIALTGEKMTNLLTGLEYSVSTTVELPAYGYIILGN